jgi:hypothetical protein
MKRAEDFRTIPFQLLQQDPRQAVGDLEPTPVLVDKFQEKPVGGEVTLVGHLSTNGRVLVIVKIPVVIVEYGIVS